MTIHPKVPLVHAAARCGVLLMLATGCGGPAAPTVPSPSRTAISPSPAPAPPASFPPVSRPARVYLFAHPLSYPVREWTTGSRFVLYGDHTFALQYLHSRGSPEYRGTYAEGDGTITFLWEGSSSAGAWGAVGEFTGDDLSVRYNLIMELSDFENAVYSPAQ